MSPATSDPSAPIPFRVDIPDTEVARLKHLLQDTRLPDTPFTSGVSWEYGVDLDWMKKMRDTWLNEFDWRAAESRINQYPQFKVTIEGISLHFIHQRSERPDAVPILFSHGWPGTFWEFNRIINLLSNPPPGEPAFHVVIPSLPGFGFSSPPPKQGWTMKDNARVFDRLMVGVLGYPSYMAQGGDWGSWVTCALGSPGYPNCKMVNLNLLPARPPATAFFSLLPFLLPVSWRTWMLSKVYTDQERADFSRTGRLLKHGMGYFAQQATRPTTVAYAMSDSPIAILAWIGEKYSGEFSDPSVVPHLTEDILTTLSIYFFTQTLGTAGLPYRESLSIMMDKITLSKPVGSSRFPYDVMLFPMSWLRSAYPSIFYYKRHENGGHFAALEVPDLLAGDLRQMVKLKRDLFD